MLTKPRLVERTAQTYVAIHAQVPMNQLSAAIDRSFGALFAWLSANTLAPSGAPFVKYNRIDMASTLELEFGAPTLTQVTASGEVHAGVLPAGRYAVAIHHGHYDGLRDATTQLLASAKLLDVVWDSESTSSGERFACRIETYLTDPRREPDPTRWQTELAIKTGH